MALGSVSDEGSEEMFTNRRLCWVCLLPFIFGGSSNSWAIRLATAALLSLGTVVWRRRAWKKKRQGAYEELPTFDSEDYRLDAEKKVRRRSRHSLPAS